MSKSEQYNQELLRLKHWDDYLLANSNLPGPRGNLELMQAFIEVGDEKTFLRYIKITPAQAPVNTPGEFLAFCGTVGLGKIIAPGKAGYFEILRQQASDPRWRIREGVAWALDIAGRKYFEMVLSHTEPWASGNFLEQRAVAAGLSHPVLLKPETNVTRVLAILDLITRSFRQVKDRKNEDFRTLRQGLAYCWSVAVAACPGAGKPVFEKLSDLHDPDIHWIMKENLKKNRLVKMDKQWVDQLQKKLEP